MASRTVASISLSFSPRNAASPEQCHRASKTQQKTKTIDLGKAQVPLRWRKQGFAVVLKRVSRPGSPGNIPQIFRDRFAKSKWQIVCPSNVEHANLAR